VTTEQDEPVEQPSSRGWSDEAAILEMGVPPLPADIGNDEAVAIARWVGLRFACRPVRDVERVER
jgi:hypothetical protein